MDREGEAADAYGRAAELAEATGLGGELWTLQLLRGGALERADRWPEAKQALQAALALAPEQPLILNYLGYAKLERGEDLDGAEAMIAKASALAPEDASITDSLGWAQYKRGRLPASDLNAPAGRGDRPEPGRDPRASRRRALCRRAAVRGALRLGSGDDRRRGRRRQAAQGQARGRPDPSQRSALSALSERAATDDSRAQSSALTPSSTSRSMSAAGARTAGTTSKPSSPFARMGTS